MAVYNRVKIWVREKLFASDLNAEFDAARAAINAVDSDQLVDNAVTNSKIAAVAVTTAKIATSAVTGDKISDGAVTDAKIVAATITRAKLAPEAAALIVIDADTTMFPVGAAWTEVSRIQITPETSLRAILIFGSLVLKSTGGLNPSETFKIRITRAGGGPTLIEASTPDTSFNASLSPYYFPIAALDASANSGGPVDYVVEVYANVAYSTVGLNWSAICNIAAIALR